MHTLCISPLLVSWELALWINWVDSTSPSCNTQVKLKPQRTLQVLTSENAFVCTVLCFLILIRLGWETWSLAPGEVSMTSYSGSCRRVWFLKHPSEAKGDWEKMEVKSVPVCVCLSLSLSFSLSFLPSLSFPPLLLFIFFLFISINL